MLRAGMSRIERWFRLRERGTSVRREVAAGLVTFATLSYILFVQPAVLATAGMDEHGVLFATCVASAAACFLMAWWADQPFALAPAMGHNFFFAFAVCGAMGWSWQQALAANLIAGALFLALAPTGLREWVMDALPASLRAGIAGGIGILIALLGLEWGNIVVADAATFVRIGALDDPVARLTLAGLVVHAVLLARRVPGAILIGLSITLLLGWGATRTLALDPALVEITGVVGAPPSPRGTAFHLDFAGLFAHPLADVVAIVFVFLFLDLFDSIGPLLGLGRQANLLVDGRLPRVRGALAADAAGTVIGAALGTSTVSSYVESASGIAAGGRTGLVAVVVGLCFLASLFLAPLVQVVGAGVLVSVDPAIHRYPVVAPILILVGALMRGALRDVEWEEPAEAIPAFLTVVLIPLGFSIADGIGWGLAAYALLALVRGRRPSPILYVLATLFVARRVFLGA